MPPTCPPLSGPFFVLLPDAISPGATFALAQPAGVVVGQLQGVAGCVVSTGDTQLQFLRCLEVLWGIVSGGQERKAHVMITTTEGCSCPVAWQCYAHLQPCD